jgi:selenocysteine lyase/cysteine desulfurase
MHVGLPWAHERAARLARSAAARLQGIPGVVLVTPPGRMGTLVTFRLPGWPAERVADELARRVFAIVRSIPGMDAVRLSVGFFTSEEELARVLDTVAELARHTPSSLPPRPAIEFVELPRA